MFDDRLLNMSLVFVPSRALCPSVVRRQKSICGEDAMVTMHRLPSRVNKIAFSYKCYNAFLKAQRALAISIEDVMCLINEVPPVGFRNMAAPQPQAIAIQFRPMPYEGEA